MRPGHWKAGLHPYQFACIAGIFALTATGALLAWWWFRWRNRRA